MDTTDPTTGNPYDNPTLLVRLHGWAEYFLHYRTRGLTAVKEKKYLLIPGTFT